MEEGFERGLIGRGFREGSYFVKGRNNQSDDELFCHFCLVTI